MIFFKKIKYGRNYNNKNITETTNKELV